MEANWTTTLIIGSILSIPISILANLMTPTFQKWFDKRARTAYSKSLTQLKKEFDEIKMFREQPNSFQFVINEYLIKGVLVLCSLALGTAYFAALYVYKTFPINVPSLQSVIEISLATISMILWLFLIIFILSMVNGLIDLLRKFSRLKQFEKYENATTTRIQELETSIIEQAKK